MAPLRVVLLCGPTGAGKSFLTERVMAVEYDVKTQKADSMYRRALKAADVPKENDRPYGILTESVKLRTEHVYHPDTVRRFFSEYETLIASEIATALEWNVALVLEGLTFRYADEVETVVSAARSVTNGPFRVARVQLKPPIDEWNRNRAAKRSKHGLAERPKAEAAYNERMSAPRPVQGVRDYVVDGAEALRDVMDTHVKLRRHKWYQRYTLGPIQTRGPSRAGDKLATVSDSDVHGKRVLDFCCATGVIALMLKDRGAVRVVGVDNDPRKHCKSLELRKTLLRHSDVDARVDFRLGDAFSVLPSVGTFDTIVFFGAIHYFPDYAAALKLLGEAATEAMYIEFTFSEKEHKADDAEEGIRAFVRSRSGNTIYMGSRTAVDRVIEEAIPSWVVEDRTPISAPGAKLKSDRQVWRLRRRR